MEQQPPPTYPSYPYAPPPPLPTTNPRVRTIGILNIVFAILHLGCSGIGGISLLTASEQARQVFGSDLPIYADGFNVLCVNGLAFALLLLAGIFLLQKRKVGRTLTLVAAIAIPVLALAYGIAVVILFTAVDVPTRYRQALEQMRVATLGGACVGTVIRMIYPIVAAAVLGRKPEELGLS